MIANVEVTDDLAEYQKTEKKREELIEKDKEDEIDRAEDKDKEVFMQLEKQKKDLDDQKKKAEQELAKIEQTYNELLKLQEQFEADQQRLSEKQVKGDEKITTKIEKHKTAGDQAQRMQMRLDQDKETFQKQRVKKVN